jgi:large subunit ribosomal protein L7/L12
MSENISKIAEDIVSLKISEAIKLVDLLCEKLGISKESLCAAPAAVSGSASGDSENAAEAKTEFDLILKSFGEKKLDVIKLVKEVTGLGLKESKELVESCPKAIKQKLSKDECESLKKKFEDIGSVCEVK